jgi:ankyrin repeat protein
MHFKQNVLETLLKNKVSLNCIDHSGMSGLHFAAERGNVAAAEKLLEAVANVELGRDDQGRTVIHHAIQRGDEKILDLLIKKNASVNDRYNKGKSALYYTTESRNVRAAIKLLEAGATVEGKDNERRTVLHLAAQNGDVKLLDLLIKN